jgi:hypothetical protein
MEAEILKGIGLTLVALVLLFFVVTVMNAGSARPPD